jgi:hypothetical protein
VPKANAADMAPRAKPARPADTQLPRKAVNAAPGTADADDEGWAEF